MDKNNTKAAPRTVSLADHSEMATPMTVFIVIKKDTGKTDYLHFIKHQ